MEQFDLHTAGADEYPKRLRMLIVGPPGSGKTHLASTFPNALFACSGGDLTTLSHRGNVPYVNVDTLKDLYLLKQALDRPIEERTELFGREIDTLVIDTVDELQRLLLWEHVRNEGRTDTVAGDWGWIAERFHFIFEGLKQVDIHLVILARTKDVQYGESHAVLQPALGGAFAEAIHKYVDVSSYLQAVPNFDVAKYVQDLSVSQFGTSTGEIEIKAPEPEVSTLRYLRFTSLPYVPWANDKTATLPATLPADDQTFLNIWERFSSVQLQESNSQVVEIPQQTVETPEGAEPSAEEYVCDNCTDTFAEKTWKDLSNVKFKKTLCGNCYKKQK